MNPRCHQRRGRSPGMNGPRRLTAFLRRGAPRCLCYQALWQPSVMKGILAEEEASPAVAHAEASP